MLEFALVFLLVLAPLVLGLAQLGLLTVARHELDLATSQGLRQAALRGATADAVRREFARVLSAYSASHQTADAANAAQVWAQQQARLVAPGAIEITRRSPGASDFRRLGMTTQGLRRIPNTGAEFRAELRAANTLRMDIDYCAPLIVPFVSTFMVQIRLPDARNGFERQCLDRGGWPMRASGFEMMQSAPIGP
jgi:hypothetical protein